MQKVSEYVFRRDNGVLHYMRAIPKDVRELDATILKSCGLPRHQYWRSLKTGDRREATARVNHHDFYFEKMLSKARAMARSAQRSQDSAQSKPAYAFTPDDRDLDRLVRDWLIGYQKRFGPVDDRPYQQQIEELEDVVTSLQYDWRQNSAPFSISSIADEMIAEHRLNLQRHTPLYRRFLRIIHRGQLEFYRRLLSELRGQAGKIFDQELFHPTEYEQDRRAGPQSLATIAKLADDWINQPGASTNTKTIDLKTHRIGVIVEALGPNKKVTSITREDCERVLRETILKYPKNITKRLGQKSLSKTMRAARLEDDQTISPKTQADYVT